jgi:hypothetical protein
MWTGLVRYLDWTSPMGILVETFDHYFGHNLLTVSTIDPILLPLAS